MKKDILGPGYGALPEGISQILEAGRRKAAWSLNSIMCAIYWEIGRRIVAYGRQGKRLAEYASESSRKGQTVFGTILRRLAK